MNTWPASRILSQIAALIPLGYQSQIPAFVQAGGQVFVQSRYKLSKTPVWPSMHIETGPQSHRRVSGATTFAGQMQAILTLYARWEQDSRLLDDIRAQLDSDIELVWALLQGNEILKLGNTQAASSIPGVVFSPYKGEVDDQLVTGSKLVYRTLIPTINIMPYD